MIDTLRARGFTYVSFHLSNGVSVTAWRGNERKTYSTNGNASAEQALAALLAQIDAPDFEDIL